MAVTFLEEDYPLPSYTPLLCGLVGGALAAVIGREKTRIDNFALGGLFSGFAAYRDPRASVGGTLLVAIVEGAIAGVADRLVPELKEALLPAEHHDDALAPSAVIA